MRLSSRIVAVAAATLITTGCVMQPVDDSALVGFDPELGATPAPVDAAEAERVADEAQTLAERHVSERKATGVWTAPRADRREPIGPVGLIRDDPADNPTADDTGRHRTPREETRDDEPVAPRPRQARDEGGRDGNSDGAASDGGDTDDGVSDDDGGGGGGDRATDDVGGDDDGGGGDPPPEPRPPSRPTWRALGGASDAAGDVSGQSPRYADITELLIESNDARARVTVAVASAIPDALDNGEVQGIGIDFYRSENAESDYQLFIDGGDEGWRAFLQSPDGVVEYPGSFGVGGRVFVLELPWEALGGRQPARVNMFVDWSKRDTPLNRVGNDRAPDEGKVRIDPR